MRILIDDNNVVTAVIDVGDAENSIEAEEYPADLVPLKYKYVEETFEINPDYVEPTDEPTSDEPTADELLNIFMGVDE